MAAAHDRQAGSARSPVLWKGAVAGLAAGLVASVAMDRFQTLVSSLSSSSGNGESATERAADRVATATAGQPVPEESRPVAGQGVHYVLGAALGIAYGVAAEMRPEAAKGRGTVFGGGVAALLDEAAVPLAGLGTPPWRTKPATHLYTLASHLLFGATAEATRRVARRLLG